MQIDYVANRINYVAPQHVRDVVASLGRTEDVRFSPSKRRLAVAQFLKNKITVFEVSIAASQNSKSVALTGVAEISSPDLHEPHGIDFFDDEKILVANRRGQACIFELPAGALGSWSDSEIFGPSSLAVGLFITRTSCRLGFEMQTQTASKTKFF